MKRLLLSPDEPAGSIPAPAAPVQTPPPTAAAVIAGLVTEADVEIHEELKTTRQKAAELEQRAKKLETDVAYLQDENRRLKTIPTTAPAAAPKTEKTKFTFFDED